MTKEQRSAPPASDLSDPPPVPGAGTLAVLALAWLLAVLSSVRHTIGAAPEASELLVTQAALALPAVISASLLAGAAVGLVALNLVGRRAPGALIRTGVPFGVGAAAGAATGLVGGAIPFALGYGRLTPILVLCAAVTTAATVGGLLAGVRHRVVVAAGLAGALGVFVVGFAVGVFDGGLLTLFGAGDTAESVVAANAWVALTASLVAGLAAGALGYAYLRRGGGPQLRWPAYLVAGAMPGLLVLLAEAITRLQGARLFQAVSAASADDQAVLNYFNGARFNRAMIVLFVGALVAIFLLGRALRPAEAPARTSDADQANHADQADQADEAEVDQAPASS
jgi:hypothetical protein